MHDHNPAAFDRYLPDYPAPGPTQATYATMKEASEALAFALTEEEDAGDVSTADLDAHFYRVGGSWRVEVRQNDCIAWVAQESGRLHWD